MEKDFKFDLIEDALEDLKNGKMIMVVDDEDGENESCANDPHKYRQSLYGFYRKC